MDLPARPHELLLTGVTGFVGKVILEAALRRRRELGIGAVHVVIRPQAGQSARDRFAHEVRRSRCFERLAPGWEERVHVVSADLARSDDDGRLAASLAPLRERVSHVVHAAASVEFDLPLSQAVASNVTSSLQVLAWVRSLPRPVRLVSLSTAYVTPASAGPVEEALAPLPWPAEQVLRAVREGDADEASLLRESGHPNTYTLSKCLAEHQLAARRGDVPLVLLRPSIVSATWREPFPGWIDSRAAFAAFVMLIGSGQLRAVAARRDTCVDLVPCDAVARLALDACFAPSERGSDAGQGLRILHAVAGRERAAPVTLCAEVIRDHFGRRPLGTPPKLRYLGPTGLRFSLNERLHHRLRLGTAALWHRVRGETGRLRRVRSLGEQLRYVNRAFPYFTHTSFDFRSSAPWPDPAFEPRAYLETVCGGIDTMMRRGTLAAGRRRERDGAPARPHAAPRP